MSYLPLFDLSTLHYTNYALQFLLEGNKNKLRRYITAIQNLYLLGQKSNDIYPHLRDSVYALNGGKPDLDGFQLFKGDDFSIDYGPFSKGGELVRLIFGILCLIKFVEAICFSEQIYYTSASPWMTVSVKDRWPHLNMLLEDSNIKMADALTTSADFKKNYYKWLTQDKYTFYNINKSVVEKFAMTCFEFPFINLASLLFDTSFGISSAPMSIECTPNFEVIHPKYIWNDNNEINILADAINPNETSLSQLRRMYYYLMRSFQYQYIADCIDGDYVWNEIRGPFLWSILSAKGVSDIDRLFGILALGVNYYSDIRGQHFKNIDMQKSFVFDSSAIFRLVLSRIDHLNKIFSESKIVQTELEPIRHLLNRDGNSEKVIHDIFNVVDHLSSAQNDYSINMYRYQKDGLKIMFDQQNRGYFNYPTFTGGFNFYNGYISLIQAYMGAYSAAERLSKLVENR